MPHVIVEYSANIEAEITPQRLVEEIHQAAIASGIAEPVAVRTRLKRREHFRVGDGSAENAFVHIDIRARKGRTLEQKKALFKRTAELLGKNPGIRPEDVFIVIVPSAKENWSVGNGVAQFA